MKISPQIKIDDLLTLTEVAIVLIRVATEVVAEEDKVDMVGALLLAHYFHRRTMAGMKYSTPSMVCLLTSDPKIMISGSFFHPPMYVRIALKTGLISRSTGPQSQNPIIWQFFQYVCDQGTTLPQAYISMTLQDLSNAN